MPPAIRRQGDHYYLPPQAHSPVPMNMYSGYHHPAQFPGAHPYYPQQFYPPQYHHPQYQHALPPRHFPQHPPPPQQHSPVVVSSHPHIQSVAPVHRQPVRTPPVAHTHTPPAPLVAHQQDQKQTNATDTDQFLLRHMERRKIEIECVLLQLEGSKRQLYAAIAAAYRASFKEVGGGSMDVQFEADKSGDAATQSRSSHTARIGRRRNSVTNFALDLQPHRPRNEERTLNSFL